MPRNIKKKKSSLETLATVFELAALFTTFAIPLINGLIKTFNKGKSPQTQDDFQDRF